MGEIQQELARRKFWHFCLYYDPEFFKSRPFLKDIADVFQYVYDEYVKGNPTRVTISLPPRSGKSYITSLFCAWWLGNFPELSIMRNSCTATLYRKFSYDVRNIVKSEQWQEVFEDMYLSADKTNVDGWNLTEAKQVSYFGAGVGGTIIGFGANLAISDDLYRGIDDALSENYNEGVIRWKESSHDSRKEKNCPEIFIGTRWSKNDIIGRALDSGKINKEIRVAALTPDNESFCDAVKSTAEYLDLRDGMDDTIWEAEYQQEPIENKGLLFPISALSFYNPKEYKEDKSEYCGVFVDPADTGGDFYAAPKANVADQYIYITEVIFNNNGTDINIPATVDMALSGKAHYTQVEGNSGWVMVGKDIRKLIQEKNRSCDVRIVKPHTNKDTRILAFSAFIIKYFRFRSDYKDNKAYAAFMKNLTGYLREGGSAHDDAPDICAQIAAYMKAHFPKKW